MKHAKSVREKRNRNFSEIIPHKMEKNKNIYMKKTDVPESIPTIGFEPRIVDKLVKRRDENSSVGRDKGVY